MRTYDFSRKTAPMLFWAVCVRAEDTGKSWRNSQPTFTTCLKENERKIEQTAVHRRLC